MSILKDYYTGSKIWKGGRQNKAYGAEEELEMSVNLWLVMHIDEGTSTDVYISTLPTERTSSNGSTVAMSTNSNPDLGSNSVLH